MSFPVTRATATDWQQSDLYYLHNGEKNEHTVIAKLRLWSAYSCKM